MIRDGMLTSTKNRQMLGNKRTSAAELPNAVPQREAAGRYGVSCHGAVLPEGRRTGSVEFRHLWPGWGSCRGVAQDCRGRLGELEQGARGRGTAARTGGRRQSRRRGHTA